MYKLNSVSSIRNLFVDEYIKQNFVTDKTGVKTLEVLGTSFVADEPTIFGQVNEDYAQREVEWYNSCSLYVKDIPGKTPAIWENVSSKNGEINSNYGYLIFSPDNGFQYDRVKEELLGNPYSRRAVMIYTRPSMHSDYNRDGMSDFICTNSVQYVIRDKKLHALVQMRSNDVFYGYRNDRYWQKYVLNKLATDLVVDPGRIYWNAGSLHMYEKDFYLLEHFYLTGDTHISKKDFDKLYA